MTLVLGFVGALIVLSTRQNAILAVSAGIVVCIVFIVGIVMWERRHARRVSAHKAVGPSPQAEKPAPLPPLAEAQAAQETARLELVALKEQCTKICGPVWAKRDAATTDGERALYIAEEEATHAPHKEALAAAYAKFSAIGRVVVEIIDGPPKPLPSPLRRSDLPKISRAGITMTAAPQTPGSRTYRVKFDTSVLAGQAIRLPFKPTGLALIEPIPIDDHVAQGPDAWRFKDGKVVIHEITDTGFSVEVQPNDLVVVVEIDAYGSPV